jgi:hypothetical protein
MRWLEHILKKILLARPSFWEKNGIQITYDHFYYPIPNSHELTPELFARISKGLGIDWNISDQDDHLERIFGAYIQELESSPRMQMMSAIDGAIYYAMIRHYRPQYIIEVGCGESTRIAAQAVLKNRENGACQLVCIEPFPGDDLVRGFNGLSGLIQNKVQDVSFDDLEKCDMLFIDSSHVVRMGSDVVWEVEEILPRLKKGCLIHFHDIFIPREYPETWARNRIFWSEQYMIWAFLMFNDTFKIIWGSQFMSLRNRAKIDRIFKQHNRSDYPLSSLWIKKTQ